MDGRTFLALEISLTRRLTKSWKALSTPIYEALAAAVTNEDWHAALQFACQLDMTHVGEDNRRWIKHMLLSCAVYGSKMANKRGPQFLAAGSYDQTLDKVTTNICQYFTNRATAQVQAKALQSIARAEAACKHRDAYAIQKDDLSSPDLDIAGKLNPEQAETQPKKKKKRVVKADENGRFVTPFVSFADEGLTMAQMASGMNSSRLSSWGFFGEAQATGQTRYTMSAVLDGRCCAFCEQMDGREFSVDAGNKLITEALSVEDPADLAEVQPWPETSKAAVAGYAGMSDQEIQDEGFGIGPYHPLCRCLPVSLDDQGEQSPGMQEGDNNGPIEDQEATQDDFMSLGADISDEELQYWNDNVGIPPAIMLEEMFGGDMDALLTKLKQSFSLESDSTAIFKESGMLADGTFDVTTILDPFSGKLFLSEADFAAAGVDDAAAFMSQVFNGMIDTGMSAGAAMLVADVGDSAYQYAQLGFLPDAEAWQTIRMDGIDLLQDGVLKDSFAALDADQKDLLLNLLSNPDEQALQALVDLPIEIEGKSIGEIILNGVSGQFQLDLLNEEAVARAQEFFN